MEYSLRVPVELILWPIMDVLDHRRRVDLDTSYVLMMVVAEAHSILLIRPPVLMSHLSKIRHLDYYDYE